MSVPWSPQYAVRITLHMDFDSVVSRKLVGALSKRRNHNAEVPHARQGFGQSEGANPALEDEDADTFLTATDRAVPGKKTLGLHAPNTQTQLGFWKRQTRWTSGVQPLLSTGRAWVAKEKSL